MVSVGGQNEVDIWGRKVDNIIWDGVIWYCGWEVGNDVTWYLQVDIRDRKESELQESELRCKE